jgi:uncharacterized membrane protein
VNIVLWILQGLLAAAFLFAGSSKALRPKESLAQQMAWVEDFSPNTVKAIGTAEILGALGLVLPAWTGIAPILTPLAAVGLMIVMIGAAVTHVRRKENQMVVANAVLFVLLAVIAWGRFGPYSY